jgi:hypothetical protein
MCASTCCVRSLVPFGRAVFDTSSALLMPGRPRRSSWPGAGGAVLDKDAGHRRKGKHAAGDAALDSADALVARAGSGSRPPRAILLSLAVLGSQLLSADYKADRSISPVRKGRSMIAFTSIGLLGLLALSIPVGIVLFLLAFGIDAFFSPFPLMRGLGSGGLVVLQQRDADRDSALRAAGRDPGAQRRGTGAPMRRWKNG